MTNRPKSFLELDSWKNRDKTRDTCPKDVESKISKYYSETDSSKNEPNLSFKENVYFDLDMSKDFIKKVDSDSREISKNNRNLEQKIKAELAGVNIFKKGEHILRTITSRDYRESNSDGLINNQLRASANFRDSIKMIYLKLSEELNKNTENLNNLERNYFGFINEREGIKKTIKTSQEDYGILKKALEERKGNFVENEKLKMGKTNAHRVYRKAVSKLDELNNAIVNNVEEREFNYTSEIIFERYEGAFKKIYETSESEIRKIERVKGLYLNAMRGGKIVNNLERSFEEVFSSLRLMDNVLLKGINSIMVSSSGKGRMRELREEKSRNSRRLMETIKEVYVPNAEKLDAIVENYIRGKK